MEEISFSFTYMFDLFLNILQYLHITLIIAIIALVGGMILGTILAVIKHNKILLLSPVATIYINFLRSTPFIVQLFLFYYGLATFFETIRNMSPEIALTITLSINSSAYIAEIIRGAIDSVPAGQMEACLSSGMTNIQAMKIVILPQALRVAIPSISNTFVDLVCI